MSTCLLRPISCEICAPTQRDHRTFRSSVCTEHVAVAAADQPPNRCSPTLSLPVHFESLELALAEQYNPGHRLSRESDPIVPLGPGGEALALGGPLGTPAMIATTPDVRAPRAARNPRSRGTVPAGPAPIGLDLTPRSALLADTPPRPATPASHACRGLHAYARAPRSRRARKASTNEEVRP